MTELQLVIDQLQRMYAGRAWHGPSLTEALDGVDVDLATKRVGHSAHSIFDLVHHVAAWIGEAHARIGGRVPQMPDDGDFPASDDVPTAADWTELRQRLDTNHATLIADLNFLDPGRLSETISTAATPELGEDRTVLSVLHGLVQHNAYHIGQIVLIRRAVGS